MMSRALFVSAFVLLLSSPALAQEEAAPSPGELCEHAVAHFGEPPESVEPCMEALAKLRAEVGDERWANFGGCILEAMSKDAGGACLEVLLVEESSPEPQPMPEPVPGDHSTRSLCEHAVTHFGEPPESVEGCVKGMEGLREQLPPEAWAAFGACVIEARSKDEGGACLKEEALPYIGQKGAPAAEPKGDLHAELQEQLEIIMKRYEVKEDYTAECAAAQAALAAMRQAGEEPRGSELEAIELYCEVGLPLIALEHVVKRVEAARAAQPDAASLEVCSSGDYERADAAVESIADTSSPEVKTLARRYQSNCEATPDALNGAAVKDAIRTTFPDIKTCSRAADVRGKVKVTWTVEPSGQTSGVTIETPEFQSTRSGACVKRVLEALRFPRHSSNAAPVTNLFLIQ